MSLERVHPLDAEALELFATKGKEGGPAVPQSGLANAFKVRRVMQVVGDLAGGAWQGLRIADFGCGEGVYAIEAALRGASVTALDARTQRMDRGRRCAERHGITNVTFMQGDVRTATRETLGSFDIVLVLGLLYHLDAPAVFAVLGNLSAMCGRAMIVDTLVSLGPDAESEWAGRRYAGERVREHEDSDSPEARRDRVLRSIDNTFSFRFTRESLMRALHEVAGFTTVLECHVPHEPGKAPDRVTLVSLKGSPVLLSSYPSANAGPA